MVFTEIKGNGVVTRYLFQCRSSDDSASVNRHLRYLTVAIALASDKIAVIKIIPKATSSIK
jgi:hypothetical protein